tara:strand:- start:20464 stop:21780 length:1317 start_codon:yes stop_codon:yes gene_type:complete
VDTDTINSYAEKGYNHIVEVAGSTAIHTQLIAIFASVIVSYITVALLRKLFIRLRSTSEKRSKKIATQIFNQSQIFLLPAILIFVLSITEKLYELTTKNSWLISITQTLAVLIVVNRILVNYIKSPVKRKVAQILVIPITLLFFMGWLDEISVFLDSFKLSVGNITITLNSLIKTSIFGTLLFWLGKASSIKGQSLIRSQKGLDVRSKELFAKLFEIALYILIFILLLEIVGVDFTTLAIFGGAVGIGLGFGLQSIASNFISGIILLLDRSLSVGDHIELEDGQQGVVRELNMRSATVETYDGKDVLVPNEKFISSTFINWTHANTKQRYSLNLQVSYNTDLHKLFDIIRETVSTHPQVLSGESYPIEERPDAEISSFGDSGVNILIEFWMDGIDDGRNKVGADLLLMIWDAFKEHNIQIPYPQREITLLNKKLEEKA